jgi:hypothetical protein
MRRLGKSALLLLAVHFLSFHAFAQGHPETPAAPLDPVQARQEARALVAEMLAQRPAENSTNTGRLLITDEKRQTRTIAVRIQTFNHGAQWTTVYEATNTPGEKLTVTHSESQPNEYWLAATNGQLRQLASNSTMVSFAGSDFWVADLGLEFLRWPDPRVKAKEMRHSRFCDVVVFTNPDPNAGGYSRVEAWIVKEAPHGIAHADAFDRQGNRLKEFDPTAVEKVEGQYQLESMEIRNPKARTRTVMEFDVPNR